MKRETSNLFKTRAATVLLTMMLTATTAWADDGYDYIAADGTTRNTYTDDGIADANVTVLTGGEAVTLDAGWYVVNSDISYTGQITLGGDVHLILADGKTMNITTTDTKQCIKSVDHSLDIYGQTKGTGKLNTQTQGTAASVISVQEGTLGIHGGNVSATLGSNKSDKKAIYVTRNTVGDAIVIDGGTVIANGNNGYGIYAQGGDFRINGGLVTATGDNHGVAVAGNQVDGTTIIPVTLTLGGGILTASSFYTFSGKTYAGTIAIASGIRYTDGTNIYDDTTPSATLGALTNTALYPYEATLALAANAHDGNRWTTFYCGHTGYKIDDGENACAYTATYSSSTLTLHKLGKVIPKNNAVIIVGEDDEISMTASTDDAENSVSNDLHGVDVRTLTSTLDPSNDKSGTFYVMGKNGSGEFGFFEYTGQYMPARKAYLLVSGSNEALARGLTMVFADEQTGISDPTPDPSPAWEGSGCAWYSLDGRRLEGKPKAKGIFIHNGRKEVLK